MSDKTSRIERRGLAQPRRLSRRTLLRGLGTAVALPWLEAMGPLARAATEGAKKVTPSRLAVVFIPNGAHMADWTPKEEGADFELPPVLQPIAAFKRDMLILTGLTQDGARAHGDGGGDHARSAASFLTGTHPRKTHGADIKAGVSFDQIVAQSIGGRTRLPSLELGCDRGQLAGNCDSGYSCAYSGNIAWRSASTPMAKEINPRLVFERLFASDDAADSAESKAKRQLYRKSVLDFALEDARQLSGQLGGADRHKLDEYLTSIRELEDRIARSAKTAEQGSPELARPDGIPKDYKQHIRLMMDLLVLAFESDQTRVATFMLANEGSNRPYPFIDVHEGHHDLSHHGGSEEKQAKLTKINRFHMEQFAYFLDRMKNAREGEGTLLAHSTVLYGSGISDGNRHNHDDLPVLVVGGGNGTLRPGRHIRYSKNTPLNNLYVSLSGKLGAPVESLGDSNGRLAQLD